MSTKIIHNDFAKIINFRSKAYRDFIKTLPCENKGQSCGGQIIYHHEDMLGYKGTADKVSDICCLPLCVNCHHRRHNPGSYPLWPTLRDDPEFWFYLARRAITYQNEFLALGGKF